MMLMPPYTPMSEPLLKLRRRRATMAATTPFDRTRAFMEAYGLRIPVLLAPMAGACPPALSVAVGRAGGMGACGALLMQAAEIVAWRSEEHTSELQSLMRISYAVFCLKKKKTHQHNIYRTSTRE